MLHVFGTSFQYLIGAIQRYEADRIVAEVNFFQYLIGAIQRPTSKCEKSPLNASKHE